MAFIKSKGDSILESHVAKLAYDSITQKYGYTARISIFWEMLPMTFGLPKFELLDLGDYQFGFFENYLIEKHIEWENGNEIDFSEISEKILNIGDFTSSEKLLMLDNNNLEIRLWSIFTAISFPDPTLLTYKNKEND